MALQLGATFVARSFSGDKTQLVPLIKAAIEHKGAAFIDVISPCVAFNNHRRLDQELRLRARAQRGGEPARLHHRPRRRSRSTTSRARWRSSSSHDGSKLALRKLDADYDVHDRLAAMSFLQKHAAEGPDRHRAAVCRQRGRTTCTPISTRVDAPLNALGEKELCPGSRGARQIQREACGGIADPRSSGQLSVPSSSPTEGCGTHSSLCTCFSDSAPRGKQAERN